LIEILKKKYKVARGRIKGKKIEKKSSLKGNCERT